MLEIIQNLCRERGITLSRLEKDLGFSNGSIYKWDKTSPSIEKVIKVARYFNVKIEEVLGERLNVDLSERLRLLVMELSQGPYGDRTFRPEVLDSLSKNLKTLEIRYNIEIPRKPEGLIELCHETRDEDFSVGVLKVLEETKQQTVQITERNSAPKTIAAHHDGEDWTEEELQDIEEFKEILKLKRQLKKNKE